MLKIGNLDLQYTAMPSPMASFTDIAYRKLIDEIGYAGFMVTEMISAEGLRRKQERTLAMIKSSDFKSPQFVQLFGSEPGQFVDAAKYLENETNYSGIDINMGCPAPKVIRKGAGAALLKEPDRIAAILRALKSSTRLPVTVKIRLGYDQVNVFDIIDILDAEGADAVTVHFRLKADRYRGQAKWEYAPLIKERIKTVFIGNGDILTACEAREKLQAKTVDAVLIGRGAVRNPLIFAEIAGADTGHMDIKWSVNRLLELIREYYPPKLQLPRVKAFARFLFFGRKSCKRIRNNIYVSTTFEEAKAHLDNMGTDDFLDREQQG